jgi:N-sulfoglucosamine sulfohydrolase
MDGHSFLPLLLGESQGGRDKVFTVFNKTVADKDYPMRSLQTKKYGYIFNAWSDGETIFKNESQSGLTFKAMVRAAETDPEIAARVKFFQYRVSEEFYDNQKDPNALNNLIGNPDYKEKVSKMRRELLAVMESTADPITETFKLFLKENPGQ